ncbi:hypothetical protein AB5I41_09275 [Sphingomonas sp. MMS24-JH45]
MMKMATSSPPKQRAGAALALLGRPEPPAAAADRRSVGDPEIRQVVDILLRRRQNNPILIGEAGVGKTAVAEGFTQADRRRRRAARARQRRAAQPRHRADAGGREREGRVREAAAPGRRRGRTVAGPRSYFIDEAHTLIGAGGQAGTGDAATVPEAGAGARAAAHRGGDHLCRIPDVSRRIPRSPGVSSRSTSASPKRPPRSR